jgi:hypothetical protein
VFNTCRPLRAVRSRATLRYQRDERVNKRFAYGVSGNSAIARPLILNIPSTGLNGNYTVSWGTVAGATSFTLEESFNSECVRARRDRNASGARCGGVGSAPRCRARSGCVFSSASGILSTCRGDPTHRRKRGIF